MGDVRHSMGDEDDMTVLDWLFEGDPSIRWQVMRDLTDESPKIVAEERATTATNGWCARLLALQAADGTWGGRAWSPEWTDTMHTLQLLRQLGLDPTSAEARRAIGLVHDHVAWAGGYPDDTWDGNAFFTGEVEPCINGNTVAIGSYFGANVGALVDRLLGEQLPDGGWNCEAPGNSSVASFGTTINVLDGLLEFERATNGARLEVTAARRRGDAYLLERRMFRRKSTGEIADEDFTRFAFPVWWHYDVLRGLDHLRAAGVEPDERVAEAIELVESKRGPDGRWPLDHVYAGAEHFRLEESGEPSRWNTLRALRVLRWASAPADERAAPSMSPTRRPAGS